MFKVKITNIKDGFDSIERSVPASELGLNSLSEFQDPVQVQADIEKIGQNTFITVHMDASLTVICDRCAETVLFPLHEQVQLIYTTDKKMADQEEDFIYLVSPHEESVDISDPLRQTLMLALPVKRLCAVTCKGLCPVCGTNLNQQKWACTTDHTDPRWEKLKKLYSKN